MIMSALENALPDDLKRHALKLENDLTSPRTELVLPYAEALKAIAIASEYQIAILGLEAFEVQREGLLTVDLADASAYIPFTGDWGAYVAKMNAEAERWIKEHPLGENHGYILSSTSEKEFASLPKRRPDNN
jgi:hypothetical protein